MLAILGVVVHHILTSAVRNTCKGLNAAAIQSPWSARSRVSCIAAKGQLLEQGACHCGTGLEGGSNGMTALDE